MFRGEPGNQAFDLSGREFHRASTAIAYKMKMIGLTYDRLIMGHASEFRLADEARGEKNLQRSIDRCQPDTAPAGQQQVADALDDIAALKGVQPNWPTISLVQSGAQQPVLSKLISGAVTSDEPRLATVSPDLQLAIGSATTTVASGSATPAQAAATLQAAAAKLPNHGAVG